MRDMLALVKETIGPGVVLRQMPVPDPGPDWVRVRITRAGICGSDLPIFDDVRAVPLPFVPGHELAGVVDALGADVSGWRVGDRVAINMVIGCGACAMCAAGRPSLCGAIREIGIHIDGGFAEYAVAPAANLHRLPAQLSDEDATAADPLACALHGFRIAPVRSDDTVAVVGVGVIGLYAIQLAKRAGARRVIAVGRRANALGWAHAAGADAIVDMSRYDLASGLRDATGGDGPTTLVEATGAADVLGPSIDALARGGRLLVLGVFHALSHLHGGAIVRKELQINGSLCYSAAEFRQALDWLAEGVIKPVPHTVFPLRDADRAIAAFRSRETAKAILAP
jgi:L-iditol 2-dehydrogenase